jgi:hypothetical protein
MAATSIKEIQELAGHKTITMQSATATSLRNTGFPSSIGLPQVS